MKFISSQMEAGEIDITDLAQVSGVAATVIRDFLGGRAIGVRFITVEKLMNALGHQLVAAPLSKIGREALEMSSLQAKK